MLRVDPRIFREAITNRPLEQDTKAVLRLLSGARGFVLRGVVHDAILDALGPGHIPRNERYQVARVLGSVTARLNQTPGHNGAQWYNKRGTRDQTSYRMQDNLRAIARGILAP